MNMFFLRTSAVAACLLAATAIPSAYAQVSNQSASVSDTTATSGEETPVESEVLSAPVQSKVVSPSTTETGAAQSAAQPDLVVRINKVENYKVLPSREGSITFTVTNQGTAKPAGNPVYVNFFAGPDTDLSYPLDNRDPSLRGTDEVLVHVHRATFNSLLPGQSVTITLAAGSGKPLNNPSVVSPGNYTIIAQADPDNNVNERDTTNKIGLFHYFEPGADLVIKWNSTFLNVIQDVESRPTTDVPFEGRNAAIVHTAIYDTVNAFDRKHSFYSVKTPASDTAGANQDAALIGAAYESIVKLYPQQEALDQANAEKQRDLANIPDGPAKTKGYNLGVSIADKIVTLRANDNSATADNPSFTATQPGDWEPAPPTYERGLLVGWGRVSPFVIPSVNAIATQAGANGKLAPSSPEYRSQLDYIQSVGQNNSKTRTDDQTQIAYFWALDRRDTVRPPGQYLQFIEDVALLKKTSQTDNARVFALASLALADAGLAAWDLKWTNRQFRPMTAIEEGFSSNRNDNWQSLLQNPPFPDYVSGHATFSGAIFRVARNFYGTDNIRFGGTSQDLPQTVRYYNSFTEVANEIRDSRLYGGVHTQKAAIDGQNVGYAIGDYVYSHVLTPGSV